MSVLGSCSPSPLSTQIDLKSEHLPPSPSPPLQAINEECHRSTHALFFKRWYRGTNTCSRCDFEFLPVRGTWITKGVEPSGKQSHQRIVMSSSDTRKYNEDHRVADVYNEELGSPPVKKRPLPSCVGDAEITSSLMSLGTHTPCGGQLVPPFVQPDNPAWMAYMAALDPTPALRQLSEYARPHLGVKPELPRDPFGRILGDYLAANFSSSRDQLEDLERRKEQLREELKVDPGWPPPEHSAAAHTTLPFNPIESQLATWQNVYKAAAASSIGSSPGLPSGWGHSPTEPLRRQRPDQLGGLNAAGLPGDRSTIERRISAADRPPLPAESLLRLQAAGASSVGLGVGSSYSDSTAVPVPVSTEMPHTHTHSHTHLHLHRPDPAAAAAAAASVYPPYHLLLASAAAASSPFLPTGFSLPGSAAGVTPGSAHFLLSLNSPPAAAAYGLTSPQLMAAAREQELMYRQLLNRMQCNADPVLVQQLLAVQTVTQQEASQKLDMGRLHGNPLPP